MRTRLAGSGLPGAANAGVGMIAVAATTAMAADAASTWRGPGRECLSSGFIRWPFSLGWWGVDIPIVAC